MYCSNCGQLISDESKYCFKCGHEVKEAFVHQSDETTRRTYYKGSVQRCPYCNEIVNDFDIICPSCKKEFREATGSKIIQRLTNQLVAIDSETRAKGGTIVDVAHRQENVIRNYPIPDSKSDILALMLHASSNIEFDILEHFSGSSLNLGKDEFHARKILSDAWYDKEEAIYQKAKVVLKDDSSFQIVEEKHTEIREKYLASTEIAKESWKKYSKDRKKDNKKQEKLNRKQIEIDERREQREFEQRKWEQKQQEQQLKLEQERQKLKKNNVQVTNNYYYTENNLPHTYISANPMVSGKSRGVALFLCIFLGFIGAHLFYVGRAGKGILYLFTLGLCGIGWIIDIFIILAGSLNDGNGLPVKKW